MATTDPLTLDLSNVRDIAPDVLGEDGRIRVLPAAYWATTTRRERALFGQRYGIYSFPTTELVEHLRAVIGERSAIEIGAGHGVLAEALGIPATDSRQQEMPKYRPEYEQRGQAPVPYGPNIVECDANTAVCTYEPQVVIGCWVTHRDPTRPWAEGNEVGVNEEDLLQHCERYIFVGNLFVHQYKKIWSQIHGIEYPPFVYSRAINGSRDFIAYWRGSLERAAGPVECRA